MILVLQIPALLARRGDLRADPSLGTGGMFLVWMLLAIVWLVVTWRQWRTAQVVSIDDGEIRIQRIRGRRAGPSEPVTLVTDDQIAFHLYAKRCEVSLSKKRVPPGLAPFLESRVLTGTGPESAAKDHPDPPSE